MRVRTRKGNEVTLLNPAGKGGKYARELKEKCKYTNDGSVKLDKKTQKPIALSDTQAAYRSGYLDARKDSAKAYKHNQKKKNDAEYAWIPEDDDRFWGN